MWSPGKIRQELSLISEFILTLCVLFFSTTRRADLTRLILVESSRLTNEVISVREEPFDSDLVRSPLKCGLPHDTIRARQDLRVN